LHFDVVADPDPAAHKAVLPEAAAFPNLDVGHDMGEVPDARTLADADWLIYYCAFMGIKFRILRHRRCLLILDFRRLCLTLSFRVQNY
jgi:hypothetical protein